MRVDAFVSAEHYFSHFASVWHALPADARGTVYGAPRVTIANEAARFGIDIQLAPLPARGRPTICLSGNDLGIVEQPILMSHGVDQSYVGVDHVCWAGGEGRGNVIRFLVPNEQAADTNRERYPHITSVVVGSPHVEYLRTLPYEPEYDVCFSRHWGPALVPEMQSAWSYYEEAIATLPGKVALHAHPRIAYDGKRTAQLTNRPYLARFEDVVRMCALYAVDNSSTAFEFAALDRPVLLLNHPSYRRDIEHGGRFWAWSKVGANCEIPQMLSQRCRAAVDPVFAPSRRRVVDEAFPVIDGAAKLAAEAILECL